MKSRWALRNDPRSALISGSVGSPCVIFHHTHSLTRRCHLFSHLSWNKQVLKCVKIGLCGCLSRFSYRGHTRSNISHICSALRARDECVLSVKSALYLRARSIARLRSKVVQVQGLFQIGIHCFYRDLFPSKAYWSTPEISFGSNAAD